MARQLIINADDLGLSAAVNRGILEAHAAGVVTSASLLANAPGFADAVGRARAAPRLGLGLHFNLTVGRPVSPPERVPSLCDRAGTFRGLVRFVARAVAGRIARADVAVECAAQIARLRQHGVVITHLDGHHHAHVCPGVWEPVVETAVGAGIERFRVPLEPVRSIAWRPGAAVLQAAIATLQRRAARRRPAPRHPDHFRGFALTGRKDFLERLLAVLDALEPGVTELMVHPGHWDTGLHGWGALADERERELAALTSAAVRARLGTGDVELLHFGGL